MPSPLAADSFGGAEWLCRQSGVPVKFVSSDTIRGADLGVQIEDRVFEVCAVHDCARWAEDGADTEAPCRQD